MVILPLLVGCADINKLTDAFDKLSNPLVLIGAFVGVEPPDDPDIQLDGSEFAKGAAVSIMLSDAQSAADMDSSPVVGASASLRSTSNGNVALNENDGGAYTATSDDGLVYTNTEEVTVAVDLDGTHSVAIQAPPAPQFQVDPAHTPGQALTISLADQDFDSAFVVVYDVVNGQVTYDNRPTDIVSVYDWTHGGGSVSTDIPGSAFAAQSVYAVGVAGLRNSSADDIVDANTLLSTFAAGKFRFQPVYTIPTP